MYSAAAAEYCVVITHVPRRLAPLASPLLNQQCTHCEWHPQVSELQHRQPLLPLDTLKLAGLDYIPIACFPRTCLDWLLVLLS